MGRPPELSNGPSVHAGRLCERQEWILLNGMFHTASMIIERRGTKWLPHAGVPPCENTGAVEKGMRADVLGGKEQAAYLQRMLLVMLHECGVGVKKHRMLSCKGASRESCFCRTVLACHYISICEK